MEPTDMAETRSRYFGTTIPLAVISTIVIGFIALTLYTHGTSFTGGSAEALRQGGLVAFGLTGISLIMLQIFRRKSTLRTLIGTVVEAAKAIVVFFGGEQFRDITSYSTLDWTQITVIIPILTIISLYLPGKQLEAIGKRKWGRRVITAMPSLLFLLLLLTGYIVELGRTRHHELEPAREDVSAQYFESGFKVSFWKGIQLDAPDDVVFTVDPIPSTELHRLWRIQVWDRYTTQEWQKSLQQTEDPNAWQDPIPSEQDSLVSLVDDPTTYDITIPIQHGEMAPLKYQDYLPTGWWDSETYGTYISPFSFTLDTEVGYDDISYVVESDYSTYRRGILFYDEGVSNLSYSIEYYPFNYMWPTMGSVLWPEDIDESVLPRVNTFLQLPRGYPDPAQHPLTLGNATRLKEEADAQNLNTYSRAIRINDFIANNFGFDNESFFSTELAQEQPEGTDMVEWFLSQGKGTHTHFASTMAIFLRYQGIPCRVVRGYAQGDDTGGVTVVRQKHIMVWVEVFIPYDLEGNTKGRWRPFFPILPLGDIQNYMTIVWPGTESLQDILVKIQRSDAIFTASTEEPFQLNAFIANNETSPPIPVSDVSVTFSNFQTGETLGEAITNQEGIATIQTAFTFDDPHGLISLGARAKDGPPVPSVIPTAHRKYDIQWLIAPPRIVVQGQTYPLRVRLAQTIDDSGLGPGINITFVDSLYLGRGELYETPTKYWGFTNEESIAQADYSVPNTPEYPLGNHTVLARFNLGEDTITGYSPPFFTVGTVIIQPASQAASQSKTPYSTSFQRIHLHQESSERKTEVLIQRTLDFFRKHIVV